jgi:hypothetical protein
MYKSVSLLQYATPVSLTKQLLDVVEKFKPSLDSLSDDQLLV